jgi:hypothetical protein
VCWDGEQVALLTSPRLCDDKAQVCTVNEITAALSTGSMLDITLTWEAHLVGDPADRVTKDLPVEQEGVRSKITLFSCYCLCLITRQKKKRKRLAWKPWIVIGGRVQPPEVKVTLPTVNPMYLVLGRDMIGRNVIYINEYSIQPR